MEDGGNTRRVRIISPNLLINETTKKARRRVEVNPKPLFVSLSAPTAARRFVFSVLFEAIFIIIIIVRIYQSSKSLNISSVPLTSSIARKPRTSLFICNSFFFLPRRLSVDSYRVVVKYKILAIERDFLLLVSFSALWEGGKSTYL